MILPENVEELSLADMEKSKPTRKKMKWGEEKDGARGTNKTREKHTLKTPPCWNWEERSFRNPNLRKKKQVKKKIFDNFLNFVSKSSLRVTIWDNLPRWIVYVALKLPIMHLTNGVTFKFNGNDYFAKLMQR